MRVGAATAPKARWSYAWLVHTAGHTQRHAGQIITTAKIVKALAQ